MRRNAGGGRRPLSPRNRQTSAPSSPQGLARPEVYRVLAGEARRRRPTNTGVVGEILETDRVGVVWVSKRGEAVDRRWFYSTDVDVLFVVRGQLRCDFRNRIWRPLLLRPGDLLVLPPRTACRAYRWPRTASGATVFLAFYPVGGLRSAPSPRGSRRLRTDARLRRDRIALRPGHAGPGLTAARGLFGEYREWLATHREVTAFGDSVLDRGLARLDREIGRLPGAYAPPRGAIVVAWARGRPQGCGALRSLDARTAEIKRVYVRPEHRGSGLGARIVKTLLGRARAIGYRRVRLDTLPGMTAATSLYRRLGFWEIPPYWDHPVPGALFFEYDL